MTYLQSIGAEILLCLPLCVLLSKRTGLFSPAATAANFCLACLIFAFVVFWSQIDLLALQIGGIAFPITASEGANKMAAHIYTFVIFLTFCSTWGIRARQAPPTLNDNKFLKKAKNLARRMRSFHSFCAPFLFILSVGHFLFALLPNLSTYYFTDRSNIIIAPLLLSSMMLCYFSFKLPKKLYFFLYFSCFTYSFAIMLGAYSRIIPLSFVILTLCVASDSTIKKSWLRYSATIILTFISVFFLVYSLVGRSGRDQGLNYALVWQSLQASADPANAYVLISATANVFHGDLLLAECIDTTGPHYSPAYQLLSLSPFPSSIDGWDQVVDEQIRINIYTPFNTFAEAYFFSAPAQLALIAIYFACVRVMTRFYAYNFGWRRVYITTFSLFCWAVMHQYPVRNILRILFVATLLCLVLRARRPKSKSALRSNSRALPSQNAVPALRAARPYDIGARSPQLGRSHFPAPPASSRTGVPPRSG